MLLDFENKNKDGNENFISKYMPLQKLCEFSFQTFVFIEHLEKIYIEKFSIKLKIPTQ